MKTKLIIPLLLVFSSLTSFSQVFTKQGAGVTILVHGWNPDGSQPAWMDNMADAIIARGGGNGIKANITVTGSKGALTATCSNWNYDLTTATTAEIVVLVNWTAVSDHLTKGVTAQEVAAVVAPKIYQSQNAKPALSELPIHLIGHSRGGGMVFEIARLLGLQGIEVDHVTALDPHPLTATDPQGATQPIGPGSTIDTPIQIYDNILFADNYWQNIAYPKGQTITGAYNRLWTSMPGGYHNEIGYTYNILGTSYNFSDHLNTILAYHGTINLATPANNGQATMTSTERAWFNTYENAGQKSGFVYSLDIAGDRKSADIPNSGDAVIAGYHNNSYLGGNGARVAISRSGSWPNLFTAIATLADMPLTVGNTYNVGTEQIRIFNTAFRSYSNGGTCKFYLDNDRNPYNGAFLQDNTSFPSTGNNIQSQNFFNQQPSELMDGNYYALIEMNDGTNKRYIYAPYRFYRDCIISTNDEKFRSALLAIPELDANSDGDIQCSEAAAWTGEIDVSGKLIADLKGIESFTNITSLNCSNNQLSTMNVSGNTALQTINFSGNLLTQADLSKNTALTTVYSQGNRLTSLDLSKHTQLSYLNCSNNGLQVLNLKNGNNTNMTYFDARTNSKLSCIEVDNVSYSTTNWTNKDAGASYNTTCTACNVNIPDANLNSKLLNISGIDISGDGVIQCYEAAAYTGEINVSEANIADMTGIEAFTNATLLNCNYNLLTSLNVTSNTALQTLYCSSNTIDNLNIMGLSALVNLQCDGNQLSTLDVSTNTALAYLNCSYNKLVGLDLSSNTLLQTIYCSDNLLTSLTVLDLTVLQIIDCGSNQLSSLDFSTNTALQELYCYFNPLTSLTVSGLNSLTGLDCNHNQLSTLNLSTNSVLEWLICDNNLLTALDVSMNPSLLVLECQNNSLTSLNVKNGNNTNMSGSDFNATINPDLTCIQVDDVAYSTTNWTNKDAGASYNTASCHTTWTGATNSNWHTSTNWDSGAVPTGSDDVIIKNVSNKPVVNSSAQCRMLVLNPGAQLTLNNRYTLSATKFLIYSDAQNGTGTFVDLNAAGGLTVSGSTKVQQYLSSGRNWYVSSPLETASATILTATTDNTLYEYKELDNTWPAATAFTKGWGRVACIGATNGKVYTFTGGAVNTGAQSINMNRTESAAKKGFNLIGNPYPSYVNWMEATKTNLEPSIWYRTKNSGNTAYVFDTYNATPNVGTNNNGTAVTQYIAPMQAVWVRVSSGTSGTLAFSNAMRSHQDQSTASNRLRAADVNAQQVVRLQVSNGINSDEAIVLFNDGANDGYDAYDSPKMSNDNPAIPEIYTVAGSENVVINGLNTTSLQKELPLGFKTGAVNTYTIKVTEFSNFDADTKMVLKDKLLNVEYELSTVGTPYRFTSDVALTNTRFSIVFKSSGGVTGIDNSVYNQGVQVYKNEAGQLTINRFDDLRKEGRIMIYNALGQVLEMTPTTGASTVVSKTFGKGVYLVIVKIDGGKTTRKSIIY